MAVAALLTFTKCSLANNLFVQVGVQDVKLTPEGQKMFKQESLVSLFQIISLEIVFK